MGGEHVTSADFQKPYWRQVLDGDEPVYHDGYSGHEWAETQRDAYWEALGEAAVEIERLHRVIRDAYIQMGSMTKDEDVLKLLAAAREGRTRI
jgi:hypothetical protein